MPKFLNTCNNSLIFAPMDGVTDFPFRESVREIFGGWDYYYTDFYRIPSTGLLKEKNLFEFFGIQDVDSSDSIFDRTAFQLLASSNSQIERTCKILEGSPVKWIDLNLGCPAKKVNQHGGGASLLNDISHLAKMIQRFRNNFSRFFSAKIRIGVHDDSNFEQIIKVLNDEGVNAIALHARTRVQMYQGEAQWEYFNRAKELSNIPIIANGDICSKDNIDEMFSGRKLDGVMVGRGALEKPWLAYMYKNPDLKYDNAWKAQKILIFLEHYKNQLLNKKVSEFVILNRFKFLIGYFFRKEQSRHWRSLLRLQKLDELSHQLNLFLNLL